MDTVYCKVGWDGSIWIVRTGRPKLEETDGSERVSVEEDDAFSKVSSEKCRFHA